MKSAAVLRSDRRRGKGPRVAQFEIDFERFKGLSREHVAAVNVRAQHRCWQHKLVATPAPRRAAVVYRLLSSHWSPIVAVYDSAYGHGVGAGARTRKQRAGRIGDGIIEGMVAS